MLDDRLRLIQSLYQTGFGRLAVLILLPDGHEIFFLFFGQQGEDTAGSTVLLLVLAGAVRVECGGDIAFIDFPYVVEKTHEQRFSGVQPGVLFQHDRGKERKVPGMFRGTFLFPGTGPGCPCHGFQQFRLFHKSQIGVYGFFHDLSPF